MPDAPPLNPQPAPVAARREVHILIDGVDAACRRLADGEDDEALHDFRVALRRLRSFIRAYKRNLPIGKRLRRSIGDLTAHTGGARDAQVTIAWLHANRRRLSQRSLPGYYWLLGKLEGTVEQRGNGGLTSAADQWQRIRTKLLRQLDKKTPARKHAPTFADASADLIEAHLQDLEQALEQLAGHSDPALAHRARITGKRLRYLVETFKESAHAQKAVAWLKQLQDDIGELHDRHVLIEALDQMTLRATSEGENAIGPHGKAIAPGLEALACRARDQEQQLWERVQRRHVAKRRSRPAPVRRLVQELRALGAQV